MQDEDTTKMMHPEDVKKKETIGGEETTTEASGLTEYHFAGGTEYVPQTVKAQSLEEANAIYSQTRQKVQDQ